MIPRILAWSLYDLANTFFAIAMISFYFPMWLMDTHKARELTFSITLSISMAVVAVLMPVCGAISDTTQIRMRYLRWSTYACVLFTASIAFTSNIFTALILFGLANICYQLGTVFYDALLPQISSSAERGQTSGLGAAFGYLGSMLGLLFLWPFAQKGGPAATFLPAAVFFLLFALPGFFTIRDLPQARPLVLGEMVRTALLRLGITLRLVKSEGYFWRYLWATFFSSCAINTILVFMAVYTKKVLGFTAGEVIRFFLFSQSFSLVGALVLSRLIPKIGAKNTLMAIWLGWIGALALVAASLSVRFLWIAGPVFGFCLGATWSTSRVLIIDLSAPEQVAEMLGLAGLVSRVASIVGPLIWGLIVFHPGHYRHAVIAQMALLAVGVWILKGVRLPAASRQ